MTAAAPTTPCCGHRRSPALGAPTTTTPTATGSPAPRPPPRSVRMDVWKTTARRSRRGCPFLDHRQLRHREEGGQRGRAQRARTMTLTSGGARSGTRNGLVRLHADRPHQRRRSMLCRNTTGSRATGRSSTAMLSAARFEVALPAGGRPSFGPRGSSGQHGVVEQKRAGLERGLRIIRRAG
jgi:hypothetical protein